MVQIIPAILSNTEKDFKKDVTRYIESSSFQTGWVHIDFMDNKFVLNESIKPLQVAKYQIKLHKEAHLMVVHPLQWLDDLVKVGFERIIFHIEAKDNIKKCIKRIKNKGLQVGLAINSETPIEKLGAFIDKIDVILIMTIVPGFQGQPFIPQALEKVREARSKWSVKIGVDGSVKDSNIKQIVDSGVDFMIVGSFLLKGDIDENLEKIWEKVNE